MVFVVVMVLYVRLAVKVQRVRQAAYTVGGIKVVKRYEEQSAVPATFGILS